MGLARLLGKLGQFKQKPIKDIPSHDFILPESTKLIGHLMYPGDVSNAYPHRRNNDPVLDELVDILDGIYHTYEMHQRRSLESFRRLKNYKVIVTDDLVTALDSAADEGFQPHGFYQTFWNSSGGHVELANESKNIGLIIPFGRRKASHYLIVLPRVPEQAESQDKSKLIDYQVLASLLRSSKAAGLKIGRIVQDTLESTAHIELLRDGEWVSSIHRRYGVSPSTFELCTRERSLRYKYIDKNRIQSFF